MARAPLNRSPAFLATSLALAALLVAWSHQAHAGSIWKAAPPLADMLNKAAGKDTRLVIKLTTRWCTPCLKLEAELTTTAVMTHLGAYHRLAYDGQSGEGLDIAKRFNVVTFPTLLLIDARARELGRVSGYRSAPALLAELRGIEDGSFSLDRLEKALSQSPDDLALQLKLGRAWALRGERARAEKHLDRILTLARGGNKIPAEKKAAAQTLAPGALFIRGKLLELLSLKDPARAERTLRTLAAAYPSGAEAKRAGLYIAWAMMDQGKAKAGLRALSRWARGDAGRELAAATLCLRDDRALDAAARHARGAVALSPDSGAAWATLGRALFRVDRTRLAAEAMAQAVERSPDHPGYRQAMALYRKRLVQETRQKGK